MNILFVCHYYPNYGGIETVTTHLANQFVSDGHKVCICSFEKGSTDILKLLSPLVDLLNLNLPVFSPNNVKLLHDFLIKNKVEIIVNQWGLLYTVAKLISKANEGIGARFISVYHNDPKDNARIESVKLQISNSKFFLKTYYLKIKKCFVEKITSISMRFVYRKSDAYVVLSPSFKESFRKFTGLDEINKLHVIPNPVTIDSSDYYYTHKKKNKEFIYVGRLDHNQKRVHRVVEVWKNIEPLFPEWHLTFVGDGSERLKLEDSVKELSLKNVSFEGFQCDTREYFKRASALFLTSEYEGFGLVLTEAMTFGVIPIVLGSYTAVFDIVKNGYSGLITDYPFKEDDMFRAAKMIIENNKLLNEMALNAISDSKKFSMQEISKCWYKIFNNE